MVRLAVERLWITAGNAAEEYRRAVSVDVGVEPWAELSGYRTASPTRFPVTLRRTGSGLTQQATFKPSSCNYAAWPLIRALSKAQQHEPARRTPYSQVSAGWRRSLVGLVNGREGSDGMTERLPLRSSPPTRGLRVGGRGASPQTMIDGGARLATLALLVALASASCDSGGSGDTSGSTPTSTAGAAQTAIAPAIEDLARKTTMTETARRLFLEARPQIESTAEFNTHCGTVSNQHTLGCLITTRQCRSGDTGCSVSRRIHLLRVDRGDLSDVTYVAAAHEMLHVAYQEIPEAERAQLDRQLQAAIAGLDRCKVSVTFGTYGGSAASEKLTEVHSVLGTQLAKLPAALESHYSKYLSNRQAVVQAHVRTLGRHEDRSVS